MRAKLKRKPRTADLGSDGSCSRRRKAEASERVVQMSSEHRVRLTRAYVRQPVPIAHAYCMPANFRNLSEPVSWQFRRLPAC